MELFDIEKKISMFESEPYIKYVNFIQQYDMSLLKYNNNGLIYINGMYIKPAIIKNVFEDIKEITQKKIELSKKYFDLYNDILYSTNPKDLASEYDNIIVQLTNIDITLDRLHQYYEVINRMKYDNIIGITKNKNDILLLQHKTLIDSNATDKNTVVKLLKLYTEINKNTEKLLEDNKNIDHIDYYIVSLPEFNVKNKKQIIQEPLKQKAEEKEKSPVIIPIESKKINVNKKITPKQLISIKDNVKLLMADKFKFKSKEECFSQKRTQPYYMSKPELIEEIEKNESIKALMPPKYTKLPKEKICDYLFF
jgi:hypothetical protein